MYHLKFSQLTKEIKSSHGISYFMIVKRQCFAEFHDGGDKKQVSET
jgi:hypothetical protein